MKSLHAVILAALWPASVLAASTTPPVAPPVKGVDAPVTTVKNAVKPSFVLDASPTSITLAAGGTAERLTVVAFAQNGFKGTIAVKLSGLPAGVKASPMAFTMTAGSLKEVTLVAALTAKVGASVPSLKGTSGAATGTATFALHVTASKTSASLSATAYEFGANLVNRALTKTVAVLTNTGQKPLDLLPAITGDPSYSIVAKTSCGATLAAGKSCNLIVKYLPTTSSVPKIQRAVLNLHMGNVSTNTPETIALSGHSAALGTGLVENTDNPMVARYTMTLPFPGKMRVSFGPTTTYGKQTWFQSTETAGGEVSILVAGMKQSSTYHMAANVVFDNGLAAADADHTFATGVLPRVLNFTMTATTTPGKTPQPGVELLNPITGVAISDLAGNELWGYLSPAGTDIYGVKPLPNGNMLMTVGELDSAALNGPFPGTDIIEMREVNLAGDTVREISIDDLNQALSTATCNECNVSLNTFHHDVAPLPNGHWLVLATTVMNLSTTTTPALTNQPPQAVLGDVIVDLDENLQPVWAWNEFNHFDPNRHPMLFPDWMHTNGVLYSPDDGDIVVSLRHQNWVVKVNYKNGTGDGSIVWHLGEGGDFTLAGGTDPTDWQYAQHEPNFFTKATAGVFSLGLMDNGDDRIFPEGVTCGTDGEPSCTYTTIPVFQIDEKAMTATLTFHQILPNNLYSSYGGNTEEMANGNVEYDLCGVGATSFVYEVTKTASPQTVWSLALTDNNFYRAFRLPSLYPGVQW